MEFYININVIKRDTYICVHVYQAALLTHQIEWKQFSWVKEENSSI